MASTSTGIPSRSAGVRTPTSPAPPARCGPAGRPAGAPAQIPPTCPSLRITPNSRTVPSTRSAAAAAMYLGSTFRTTSGGRICAAPDPAAARAPRTTPASSPKSSSHSASGSRCVYTTRPANRRVRAPPRATRADPPPFSARSRQGPCRRQQILPRCRREARRQCRLRVPGAALAPPAPERSTAPCDWPPYRLPPAVSGPAEKPAARERGGAGTSIVLAGFSPTIASEASAVAPRIRWAPREAPRRSPAAASGFAGRFRGRKPRGTFSNPAFGSAQARPLRGPPASATGGCRCDFPGRSNERLGLRSRPGIGKRQLRPVPPPSSGRGPSGSCSIACLCIRTLGGGVNARRGPLGVTSGSAYAAFTSAAAHRGASASGVASGAVTGFTGGATNGRTTFGGATATTFGSGIGFRRHHFRLRRPDQGCGTSHRPVAPATIVCGAFTRARAGRASGSRTPQAQSPAASPASCTRRSSSRSAGSPGRKSIVPAAASAPRPRSHPRQHTAVHAARYRERKDPAGNACRGRPTVMRYSPAGLGPCPLVGASSFIRSMARCRGRYSAR